MGAILKGVFGYIFEARQQKHDLEMAREARTSDNFLRLQAELNQGDGGKFVRGTRRMLAVIGMSTLSAVTVLCTIYPEASIVTLSNLDGNAKNELLFGLISWTSSQEEVILSSGHIALVTTTVVYPAIIGFYFGPSGKQ